MQQISRVKNMLGEIGDERKLDLSFLFQMTSKNWIITVTQITLKWVWNGLCIQTNKVAHVTQNQY